MNYVILATELQQPQYAGMSDAEIVAALNAVSPSSRQRVTIERLQATAMQVSVYMSLRTAIASPGTPPALLALCQSALDLVNARFSDIDLDDPTAHNMFLALQQYGVMSPAQAAAIDALATVPGTSRAHDIGVGDVTEADIAAAREWLAAQEAKQAQIAAFTALRERLVNGYHSALTWIQMQYDAGQLAPTWDDVLARM